MTIADDIAAGFIHPNTLEETKKGRKARQESEANSYRDPPDQLKVGPTPIESGTHPDS